MVSPVTGPFVTSESGLFYNKVRVMYRQKRPYNLTLRYVLQSYYSRAQTSSTVWHIANEVPYPVETSSEVTGGFTSKGGSADWSKNRGMLIQKAHQRLKSKVRGSAGWAENIAQATSARKMFNDRAEQMADIVRFFFGRGRNLPSGMRSSLLAHGVPESKINALRRSKDPAKAFLEVQYGWRPLINDMYESMKIMTSDVPLQWISASAGTAWQEQDNQVTNLGGRFYSRISWSTSFEAKIRMGAGFSVSNPNVFLASQLGLIDPALWWKVIPYSFVVDWFVNAEAWIAQVSDWFGLSLDQPYTTEVVKTKGKYVHNTTSPAYWSSDYTNSSANSTESSSVEMERFQDLLGFPLQVYPFRGLSLERGANAIALIVSALR